MLDLFSDDMRRNPYPVYDQVRNASPVFLAPFDLWMVVDFAGVQRTLTDHSVFSSDLRHVPGRGNPGDWFIFFDPPRHAKLRALIAKAFTPRVAINLEPRIRQVSHELLSEVMKLGEVDLVEAFSGPLPMRVIVLRGVMAAETRFISRHTTARGVMVRRSQRWPGQPG